MQDMDRGNPGTDAGMPEIAVRNATDPGYGMPEKACAGSEQ